MAELKRFTDEQLDKARSVSIEEYMQKNEPENLKPTGKPGYYEHANHKSFKIDNGKWHHINGGIGGYSALDYLTKYHKIPFPEAVKQLINENAPYERSNYAHPAHKEKTAPEAKPFDLPEKNENNDKAIKYLASREISDTIISKCIKEGIVYESKKFNNCVFVGKDGTEPKYATVRGTYDNKPYRGEVKGSKKIHGFCIPPDTEAGKKYVAVFESPIDAMAHSTFLEMSKNNNEAEIDCNRLALGGVSSSALVNFLERNPQVEQVYLCLDNDEAGRKATDKIIREIKSDPEKSHIKVINTPPKHGKDYADNLITVKQLQAEKQKLKAVEIKKKQEER